MRNFTIYLAVALCTIASKLTAQESFESKAKSIADAVENKIGELFPEMT